MSLCVHPPNECVEGPPANQLCILRLGCGCRGRAYGLPSALALAEAALHILLRVHARGRQLFLNSLFVVSLPPTWQTTTPKMVCCDPCSDLTKVLDFG